MKLRSCSRREFLGMTALGIVAVTALPRRSSAAQAASGEQDLIVRNASVYTVDPRLPRAEALAVRGGRFVAVGTNAEIGALASKGAQVFDAQGMTIVPGFIDCHNHPVGETLLYEVAVGNPFDVEFVTIASILDKLTAKARQTPPGFWVEGFFYDDTKVKDQRPLNIHDLDKVSKEHPVSVQHRGGHTTFYNSKAFELAGITRDTPDPPGGTFDRDADGNLNGRVTDNALGVFEKVGQRPKFSAQEQQQRRKNGAAHISKQFVRYGLTSVHHEDGDLASIEEIRDSGELLHRVNFQLGDADLETMIATGIRTGFGDEWVRIGATREHTVDGSFSERTMSISSGYPSRPAYKGNVTTTQEALDAWVERVHRARIQINCHANGDVAIGMMMKAVERAQRLFPVKDVRPKITHCTLINDDLLRQIKSVGAIPMPFTSYAYYNADKFHFYGEEFMRHAMAFRSFLDAGIPVAAGSDFYPGPFAPLMGMQGMVTRTGWNGEKWGLNQRITVDEALQVMTLNGAHASHEEAIKGSITPGKLADFVVLSGDPHTVSPDTIKDIKVVRTVTGGTTVHQA
ncbi:MAG TPA: amidohydrolase [Steroidobacteraceae bacterium]|nr:amidohydrolase [Steroidobacteraceae bacterium]